MIPADQRFDALHSAGPGYDLRLIHEHEFTAADTAAKILLERHPLNGGGEHVIREDIVTVFTVSFAHVKRDVGIADDV
jgi:hypothetical protein